MGNIVNPLDHNDCLYYTTNYASGGRLSDVAAASWLGNRIPCAGVPANVSKNRRHPVSTGGEINVGFCDGHVETLAPGEFNKVRVSPWSF